MRLQDLHLSLRTMRLVFLAAFALVVLVGVARANEAETLRLTAKPATILADGSSTTIITAEARDRSGRLVDDTQIVSFSTTLGTIEAAKQVQGGQASATLTSATVAGVATVTATSGHATAQVQVTFSNEPITASSGVAAVTVRAHYLLYNDYEQILDCLENVDVRIGDLQIKADRAQLSFLRSRIIAQGAPGESTITISQGGHTISADRLYYNWDSQTGYISGLKEPVRGLFAFGGRDMTLTPAPSAPLDTFTLQELVPSPLEIKAERVVYLPGQEMQFTHAQIMLNGKARFTLPYHVMPMGPSKLGQAQYIGLSSRGPLLDLPYYLKAGTLGSSQLRLKYNAPEGLYGATVPGWALDLISKYQFRGGSDGNLQLTRVTSPDWGVTWTHNEDFGSDTRGYFNLDTRSGNGLAQRYTLGNFNLSNHGKDFTATAVGFVADVDKTTASLALGLQSRARPLGGGFSWSAGTQASRLWTHVRTVDPVTGDGVTTPEVLNTEGVNLRLAAPVTKIAGARITATMGQGLTFVNGATRRSTLGTVGLVRPLGRQGSFNLTYNYNDFGQSATSSQAIGLERQTVTASLTLSHYPRWTVGAYGTMGLDRHSQNVRMGATYNFDRLWSLNINAGYFSQVLSLQDFQDPDVFNRRRLGTTDLEIRLNRVLGERALALVYESYRHKVYLDYTPGAYF